MSLVCNAGARGTGAYSHQTGQCLQLDQAQLWSIRIDCTRLNIGLINSQSFLSLTHVISPMHIFARGGPCPNLFVSGGWWEVGWERNCDDVLCTSDQARTYHSTPSSRSSSGLGLGYKRLFSFPFPMPLRAICKGIVSSASLGMEKDGSHSNWLPTCWSRAAYLCWNLGLLSHSRGIIMPSGENGLPVEWNISLHCA